MYKFKYFNDQIKSMLLKNSTLWDSELEQELSSVLELLKKYGEIEGANCGFQPGIVGIMYEIKGKTFKLNYTVDIDTKNITFYEFQTVSHMIDWKTALEQDIHVSNNQPICIPQIGDPHKLIRTVDFIFNGINTSKELGIKSGSSATKDKDLARRGEYLGRSIMEIGLAERAEVEGHNVYVLTDKGKRIAESKDQETRERLLVEALLGFRPIQMIIEETTHGNKEFNLPLIQDIIIKVSLGDCGGTTNPRRARSLRALVNWITRWAGIPIRREGGIQLFIPDFFNVTKNH